MQELDNCGFLDNWITARVLTDSIVHKTLWTPNYTVVDLNQLELTPGAFRQYRISAAERLAIGTRPVIALSGGVDSQAAVQSFTEAGIDFDLACMVFEQGFNSHDVDHARLVAAQYNKPLVEINLDVIKFLHLRLWHYAERYECNSPQFACHHWFYEQLMDRGYSSIIAGGHTWLPAKGTGWLWGNNPARHAWWNFARKNNFPLGGNFLASTWQMNLAVALCYQEEVIAPPGGREHEEELAHQEEAAQYLRKIAAFRKFGLCPLPQANKFSGFERVKDYFNLPANDPWEFERRYRWPLEKQWRETECLLDLTDDFVTKLSDLKKSAAS